MPDESIAMKRGLYFLGLVLKSGLVNFELRIADEALAGRLAAALEDGVIHDEELGDLCIYLSESL